MMIRVPMRLFRLMTGIAGVSFSVALSLLVAHGIVFLDLAGNYNEWLRQAAELASVVFAGGITVVNVFLWRRS